MFNTIFGLPMHPLIVHATTVVVPTAAITVALAALWPRFRTWAAYVPLGLSLVALALVPMSTSSGESLEHKLPHNALIERHAHLADGLLPWMIVVAFAAALLLVYERRTKGAGRSVVPRWIAAGLIAVALVGSIGTGVQVARIGHSGAEAAWSGVK